METGYDLSNLDYIPSGLVAALREMGTSHQASLEEQQSLYDKYDDEELSSARQMMANLPMAGGVQTGPATILSLVHNPNSEENREYIANNKALLRAFPILKQLYGYEKHAGLDYDASNRLDQERDMAIDDFAKTFGKDNLPEMFRRGPAHQTRLDEVERNLQAKRKREEEEEESMRQKGGIVGYNKGNEVKKVRDDWAYMEGDGFKESDTPRSKKEVKKKKRKKFTGFSKEALQDKIDSQTDLIAKMAMANAKGQYPLSTRLQDRQQAIFPTPSVLRKNDEKVEEVKPFDEGTAHPEMFRKSDKLKDFEKFHEDDYVYMEQERPGLPYTSKKDRRVYRPLIKPEYEYLDKQDGGQQRGGMVGYQEGGDIPLEADPVYDDPAMGFVGTPEEGAMDQEMAARNGEMGGDNVETEVPEGSFVLNSYAVELAGIKDIEKLIDDAKKFLVEGMEGETGFATQTPTGEDVEVRVSEGEYIIPPALVRIIGRDRLEKINKRGIEEFERQQAGEEEMPQEPEGFMPPEAGGVPMPPEAGTAPMPPEAGGAPMPPEQVPQGFAGGGMAQGDPQVPLYKTLGALQGIFGPKAQQSAPPQKVVQQQKQQRRVPRAPQPKMGQPAQLGQSAQLGQMGQPLNTGNPARRANMGGFVPYSRYG